MVTLDIRVHKPAAGGTWVADYAGNDIDRHFDVMMAEGFGPDVTKKRD